MIENDIRSGSTEQSFSRGKSYYQSGAVSNTVRRGNELEGQVQGSGHAPYRVYVTLDDKGEVTATSCTCPYEWGGFCKHIVALLLTHVYKPNLFVERQPLQNALMRRSKEQLVDLISQMILLYPDLQALVDRPVPGSVDSGKEPVDTSAFRRELRRAVNSYDEWGDATADSTIYSVAAAAKRFAAAGDWRSASAIYGAILDECLDKDGYLVDDEGEFITAIDRVLQELAKCLDQPQIAENDTERRAVLNNLIDAYIWDVNFGGIGLSDSVMPDVLLTHIKQSDIASIRQRIQDAQRRKAATGYGQWGVEAYEDLLIDLDMLDNVDPEVTLQRLREQGMYSLLFEKLLALKRVDEAISVITQHLMTPFERLRALPLLTAAGQDDVAVRLGQETLKATFDYNLAYWLVDRYTARNDINRLFELRLQFMEKDPSEAGYIELKKVTEALGNWKTVQPSIIQQLERTNQFAVLARIYLFEQDWDAAWRTLDKAGTKPHPAWMGLSYLDLEVAERSHEARPQKALPVYIRHARRSIDQRNRGAYAQAANYLSIVRDLYMRIGDEEAWLDLIKGIREEFPRLRALQDELNKAGL